MWKLRESREPRAGCNGANAPQSEFANLWQTIVIDVGVFRRGPADSRDIPLLMKIVGVQQNGVLTPPHDFDERPYRINRWLPLAPIAGLIGTLVGLLIYPPLDRNWFTWSAFLLFAPGIYLLSYLQKKQRRREDVSSFFPMTTWLAFAPLLVAAIVFTNGAVDRRPADFHPGVVTRKVMRHGKSNSYYVETPSWRPGHLVERLQLPYRQWMQLQANDLIMVEVHRGALGIPWLGKISKRQ